MIRTEKTVCTWTWQRKGGQEWIRQFVGLWRVKRCRMWGQCFKFCITMTLRVASDPPEHGRHRSAESISWAAEVPYFAERKAFSWLALVLLTRAQSGSALQDITLIQIKTILIAKYLHPPFFFFSCPESMKAFVTAACCLFMWEQITTPLGMPVLMHRAPSALLRGNQLSVIKLESAGDGLALNFIAIRISIALDYTA